jgi:hypothetical protein
MDLMDLTWTGNILLNEEAQQLTRYDDHIYYTKGFFKEVEGREYNA